MNSDYDEMLVPNHTGAQDPPGVSWVEWWDVLQPYVKSWQVFTCPSNMGGISVYGATSLITYGKRGCSDSLLNGEDSNTFWWGSLAQLPSPAETIEFADWSHGNGHRLCPHWHQGMQYAGYPHVYLHNDGCNYAFYDGHVKWMRYEQTYTGGNMWLRQKTGAQPPTGPPAWPW